jgi:hypothetical protein
MDLAVTKFFIKRAMLGRAGDAGRDGDDVD